MQIAKSSTHVTRTWSRRHLGRHKGAATVEFALIASTMFMFFFGAVEFARLNQVVNASAMASYAGCRRAIVPGATAANATTEAQTYLTAGLIRSATITINPSTITNKTSTVTVTVAVPMNSNGWIPATFTRNMTITRACTLTREKTN